MQNTSFDQQNARTTVPAVVKALRLLEAVGEAANPIGISALSRRTGLGKSTVHALVIALAEERMLTSGEDGYQLGPRLIELADMARERRILDAAEPILAGLAEQTGQTALLGRVQGERVVILAMQDSPHPVSLSAPVGLSVPLLAGALGKAYLALNEQRREYVESHELPAYTDLSIVDRDDYLDSVDLASVRGYALDRGEYLTGVDAAATAFKTLGKTYIMWIIAVAGTGGAQTTAGEEVKGAARALRDAVALEEPGA